MDYPGFDPQFERAMRHASVGMALVSVEGVFLGVNSALCRILDRSQVDLLGSTWQQLSSPDDPANEAALIQDVAEGRREDFHLAKRYLRPDGSLVHGELSVGCVRGDSGAVDYLIWQLVKLSDNWTPSEERPRAALLAMIDPHVFLDAVRDATGTIIDFVYSDANEAALRYLRVERDELMATSLLKLAPRQRDSGLFDMYVRTVNLGEDIVLDEARVSSEILDKEVWLDFRGVRVGDGLSLVWRDVTSRVHAREALARAEESYRLLAENVNDVVVLGDTDGVIVWALPTVTAFLGWSPEEMAGIPFREFVHPDDLGSVAVVQSRVSHGEPGQFEVRLRGKSGAYRWVNARVRPVFDEQGEVVGRVAGWWDAEESHRVREALESAEKQSQQLAQSYQAARDEAFRANIAKTTFLSRMSHELRTPLNAVIGFAQLLAMDDLTEDQRDAVRQIRAGGKHLVGLITEILDISRIEEGRMSLSMEAVSVADAVDEAFDLVRVLAEQAGVTVAWAERDDCVGYVWADRQRVIQVLLNLLSNAVKYNSKAGSVVVSCEALANDMVAVHVRDTGPGLRPEQLARIFEPFDRLGAEDTAVEGSGIGLALSHGLAQAMNGRLMVDTTPGEGSVFSLVLHTAPAGPADGVPLPSIERAPRRGETRVLYIEDNPTNTHLMARIVAVRGGAELRTAADGKTGLAAAAAERPDLVFLDLHLPDMPGESVLTRLLELPTMDGVPIVVVTADATPGLESMLIKMGATALLTKPVDVGEVLEWIDKPTAWGPRS